MLVSTLNWEFLDNGKLGCDWEQWLSSFSKEQRQKKFCVLERMVGSREEERS